MKKLLVLVVGLTFGIVSANHSVNTNTVYEVVKVEAPAVSPFCISIVKGDYEMVKKMIELGTEVNSSSAGMTPLMYAARYNRVDIVELLVKNGAKINAKNKKGLTAIKYAEQSGADEAKALLLALKNK